MSGPVHDHDVALDEAEADAAARQQRRRLYTLMLGCIGVVYGDIGTSPLYAFREAALHVARDGAIRPDEIYGLLSMIIWTLMIIVTAKYVLFLLHLDNRGEGGSLSLMALALKSVGKKTGAVVFFVGMLGLSLFYGDAAITPAISVLSAVEGLKLITPALGRYVLPISIVILVGLFAVQKRGTASVSIFFGPVTALWFLVMAGLAVPWILQHPEILWAFSPAYALGFLVNHGTLSLVVLGSVFLAVTGAEALYADLGHFGRKPIQYAWVVLIFPCLVINYLGQGALILESPKDIDNPFYRLAPDWALWPLIILATMATIIASQAVITGAYSLTRQAISLGLLPRMEIRHTSADQEGQIYMPKINRVLLLAVLFLCLVFGSSGALASAYGISVTGTMVANTVLAFLVMWKVKKTPLLTVSIFLIPLFLLEMVFLGSNMLKVFDGGIVPLLAAAFLVVMMSIWVRGTRYLYKKARRSSVPLTDLVERLEREPLTIVPGTAVYLTSDPGYAPIAMLQNIKHNHVLHDMNIVVSIVTSHFPKVPETQRVSVQSLSSNMTRLFINYGFMEMPHIPRALMLAKAQGFDIDLDDLSYFIGRRSIVADPTRGLPQWQDDIYIALLKSSTAATDFYRLPPDRVVEIGIRMTI